MVRIDGGNRASHIEFATYTSDMYETKNIIVNRIEIPNVNKKNNTVSTIISVCNNSNLSAAIVILL
jgi:hypothetical protein